MSYDYFPEAQTDRTLKVGNNCVVLHITENWPSRTWHINDWQRLINMIKEHTDLKVVTIGKSHKEAGYHGDIIKQANQLNNVDLDFCIRPEKLDYQINIIDDTISELWHFINNSFALISFDSGPIHMAGTTDTHIIQVGASVRPEKTAPYRYGNQDYKFHYVGGECSLFCASDPKYSVKEWGTINSTPYYPECQEKYNTFKCHPIPDQIFFKLCEIIQLEKE